MTTRPQKEFGVIANPKSGKGYKNLKKLHTLCLSLEYRDRVSFNQSNDISDTKPIILKLINKFRIKILFIYGGDGTAHTVIDFLMYSLAQGEIDYIPKIVLLGGGTQKAVFQWLGWSGNRPEDIFRKVTTTPLERLPIRKLRPLRLTFVNADHNRLETHYGFIFIIGAINRVIELYDKDNKSVISGLKHTSLGAISSITGFPRSHKKLVHQFEAELKANGELINQTTPLSVVCSVTDSLLFGVNPFMGKAESNQFYAASYEVPAWIVSSMIPVLARGTYIPDNNLFFNKPVFNFSIKPKVEDNIFIDGEFFKIIPHEGVFTDLGDEAEFISGC